MPLPGWVPFFGRKDNPTASAIIIGLGLNSATPISPKVSLALQALEGYQLNVAVFACVNLITRSCAGVPWALYKRGARGVKPTKLISHRTARKGLMGHPLSRKAVRNSEVEDHPILTLLERPNPIQGGSAYTENVFGFLMINGNSYETWVTPETGPNRDKALELWTLRPDRMRILPATPDAGELIGGYQYTIGTKIAPFDAAKILHQKFFSPLDDFYGLSPIQVAARVIDGDNSAALWNRNLLENDARPPSLLTIKQPMQPADRERTQKDFEAKYTGSKNARKPLVMEGDVTWQTLAASPADLDWIQGRKLNAREIANAFGVPAEFVDTDVSSYASKEQARKGLYQDTILPLLDRRKDYLNNSPIVRAYGDEFYLDADRDQIEALHEDTTKQFTGLRSADWLSIQEKRAATGYDEWQGNPDTDPKADVPVALLKPTALPGAPQDATPPGDPHDQLAPADPALKALTLTDDQQALEKKLNAKLDAHFRAQSKALAAHLKRRLG